MPKVSTLGETDQEKRETIQSVLDMYSQGLSIKAAVFKKAIPHRAFMSALQNFPDLKHRYNQITEALTHERAEMLIDIPDEYEDIARAKLKSDNIKWLISRQNRKDYGEKLDIHSHHTVDLKGALDEANNRLRDVTTAKLTGNKDD